MLRKIIEEHGSLQDDINFMEAVFTNNEKVLSWHRYKRWFPAKVAGRITREDIDKELNAYWNLVGENEFIITFRPSQHESYFFNGWDDDGTPAFSDAWDSPDALQPFKNYFDALAICISVKEDRPSFACDIKIEPNGRLA